MNQSNDNKKTKNIQMNKVYYIFFVLLVLSSCYKNNKNYSYLEINSWVLDANPNAVYPQGELTHNFSDASVYVDDKLIGIFQVPCKVPILKSGSCNVKIYPVIKNNGISATKKVYPFMKTFETNIVINQGETLFLQPRTSYQNVTKFWIEDFEDASNSISNDPNSLAQLISGNDPSILQWGNFYGSVILDPTNNIWVGYTVSSLQLPKGKEDYLELDYRNTSNLVTGVLSISPTDTKNNPNIQLNAQNASSLKWKKIYVDLKDIISNSGTATFFEQTFRSELGSGVSSAEIQIDNVKVVYF